MDLLLDTNVIRSLGTGEVQPAGLEAALAGGIRIHLSETAMCELLHALVIGGMPWEHWRNARPILERFVDGDHPVLFGGKHGLALAALHGTTLIPRGELAETRLAYRVGWGLLSHANSAEELTTLEARVGGATFSYSRDRIRDVLAAHKSAYVAEIRDFVASVASAVPELPAELMKAATSNEAFDRLTVVLSEAIDRINPANVVRPSIRLDAFLRVHALLHVRAARAKQPYNPTKDANDSFDHMLLQCLALPAAVCTSDNGIFTDLEATGSWQRAWVVRPDDLQTPAVVDRLRTLAWPAPAA